MTGYYETSFLLFANAQGARTPLTAKCPAPGTHRATNARGFREGGGGGDRGMLAAGIDSHINYCQIVDKKDKIPFVTTIVSSVYSSDTKLEVARNYNSRPFDTYRVPSLLDSNLNQSLSACLLLLTYYRDQKSERKFVRQRLAETRSCHG